MIQTITIEKVPYKQKHIKSCLKSCFFFMPHLARLSFGLHTIQTWSLKCAQSDLREKIGE